jgi:hypothetical protein
MTDLLIDLALAALMLLAIYGAGRALRRLIPLTFWGRSAEMAASFACGLGAAATVLFALGLVGWLVPAAGWALLAVGLALAGVEHRALWADLRTLASAADRLRRASRFVQIAAVIALAFALLNLIADLAPPIEGDTVHQYLLLPRYWVAAGRYVQPTHIWAATLPGNMMMISAWALLLRNSFPLATLVTGWGMSLALVLAVYALARLAFERKAAAFAALAIFTMPDAAYLAQSAKVDPGWAVFEVLALAGFLRWLGLPDSQNEADGASPHRWLVFAGLMLGLAAGSKNQTVISIGLLCGWIALRGLARREWIPTLRALLVFAGAVLITAFPYYLYNAVVHHSPFYPVFAGLFHRLFGGTPSPRSELGTEIFYPWTVGGYLRNLWNASLGHTVDGFYLGMIAGPVFLLAIPAGWLLGAYRGRRAVRPMLIYAFAFSIVWFLVKQAARHFLPGLALLATAAGLALAFIDGRKSPLMAIAKGLILAVLAWNLAIIAGVLYWSGAPRIALGLESRTEFLQRYHDDVLPPTIHPDWETIQTLNTLVGPGGRVLTDHAASPLYIAPDIVSGNWGDRVAYDTMTDEDALLDAMREAGIEYILDYKADADQRPYTQPAFLRAHADLVYDGERTRLYRIRDG